MPSMRASSHAASRPRSSVSGVAAWPAVDWHLAQVNIGRLRAPDRRPADRRLRRGSRPHQRPRRPIARIRLAAAVRHRQCHRHPTDRGRTGQDQHVGVGVGRCPRRVRLPLRPHSVLAPATRVVRALRSGVHGDVVDSGWPPADDRRSARPTRPHRGQRADARGVHVRHTIPTAIRRPASTVSISRPSTPRSG